MVFFSCMLNFSSLAWLKVHQGHIHTWRVLMDPDWSFGGLGHLGNQSWHHGSMWYVIREIYVNSQLPSMIKSASRTQSYVEEVDSTWLEFWRIGWSLISNLTPWINIICHSWVEFWRTGSSLVSIFASWINIFCQFWVVF